MEWLSKTSFFLALDTAKLVEFANCFTMEDYDDGAYVSSHYKFIIVANVKF